MAKKRDPKERFEEKIMTIPGSGCWLWMGAIQGKFYKRHNGGYGAFRESSSPPKIRPAHIYAYETYIGPVPEGAHLDHKCRITTCVNPHHLEPVTPIENWLRGQGNKGEHNLAKTHCPNGHEYTEENTLTLKDYKRPGRTYRACRECRKNQKRNR